MPDLATENYFFQMAQGLNWHIALNGEEVVFQGSKKQTRQQSK